MTSLPIRVKLTLPFATGMALLVAAMGVFVYVRVGGELLTTVDQALSAQLDESSHHAEGSDPLVDSDVSQGPTIAEIERANGTVEKSSPSSLPPLLERDAIAAALERPQRRTTKVEGLRGESWRLASRPLPHGGVLIVGRSLAAREETLHRLARELLLATPVAVFLSALAGYLLAAAALRPVEAMRRRAAAITADTPGRRLPVPRARDELAALAVTLNAMLDRLEAAFEHERRFVADASHELRTPLALLRAELEVALRRPRPAGELEAAIRSAAEETERLVRLAEDLLLVARADDGALPIRREPTKAADLLERVRRLFAARAESLGRTLEIDAGDGVIVDADPMRLEQALGNLVDNALQHGDGTVTISARASNGRVELHVTDEGDGFPDHFASRAFDRFSRADEARSERGSGLGLSIVQVVASAHGGSAHVANRPQGGADAWIEL